MGSHAYKDFHQNTLPANFAFGKNLRFSFHCTRNKSEILYIILPETLGSFILQKLSMKTIFLPKSFAIMQKGIAVSAPVLITISGFSRRKIFMLWKKFFASFKGSLRGHSAKKTFSFFASSIAFPL